MCVIFFAYKSHPDYPLILAANRDEFYARPARPLQWWQDTEIAGGKDLEAGGAWIACDSKGRLAALTNFRDPAEFSRKARSRGHLIRDYLQSNMSARGFIESIQNTADEFNGFNLLLSDQEGLFYYTNRMDAPTPFCKVQPGVHGLSNEFLNSPWPKVESGKEQLQSIVNNRAEDRDAYFELLHDETRAPVDQLPDTGIGQEKELMLSSRFIRSPVYGTRAMTLIMQHKDGTVYMQEKLFGPEGHAQPEAEQPALRFQSKHQ